MGANLASPKPLSPHFWAEKLTGLRDEQFISTASTATTKVDTKNTPQWLYKAHNPSCMQEICKWHYTALSDSGMVAWRMTTSGFKCVCHTIADIVAVSTFLFFPTQVDMCASCMVLSIL